VENETRKDDLASSIRIYWILIHKEPIKPNHNHATVTGCGLSHMKNLFLTKH